MNSLRHEFQKTEPLNDWLIHCYPLLIEEEQLCYNEILLKVTYFMPTKILKNSSQKTKASKNQKQKNGKELDKILTV